MSIKTKEGTIKTVDGGGVCLTCAQISLEKCETGSLWREICRKLALAFRFYIEKPRGKCKATKQSKVSIFLSGLLEIVEIYFLYLKQNHALAVENVFDMLHLLIL